MCICLFFPDWIQIKPQEQQEYLRLEQHSRERHILYVRAPR